MGATCVSTTTPPVAPAEMKLPTSTTRRPTRPLTGAVTRLKPRFNCAVPTAARSVVTVPSSCRTRAAWVSTSWRAIESCASRVWSRCSSTRALASWAWSRVSAPWACSSAILSGRWSMITRGWPLRTIWPSRNRTSVITPLTCGTTVTVAAGVTVPSASSVTGTSALTAVATPTVVEGRRPPRPPGPPAPSLRWDMATASQIAPPRAASTSRTMTMRRPCRGGFPGRLVRGVAPSSIWSSFSRLRAAPSSTETDRRRRRSESGSRHWPRVARLDSAGGVWPPDCWGVAN